MKDEPHTAEKVEQGRLRIIQCVGLVDQLVDRILFSPWIVLENNNPQDVTSKSGWAPIPVGYQKMLKDFPSNLATAVDKRCWDWTMPAWVIHGYVEVKRWQCATKWTDRYEQLVWARLLHILGPRTRIRLFDGTEFIQDYWGLMKSGWLCTLSMNGMAQALQHALAWFRMGNRDQPPLIWTMGDDTLTRMHADEHAEYLAQLKTTGCIVKLIENTRDFSGFRVIGATVSDAKVIPLYPNKHQYMIKHCLPESEVEIFDSMSLIYSLAGRCWLDDYITRTIVIRSPYLAAWAKGLHKLRTPMRSLPAWIEDPDDCNRLAMQYKLIRAYEITP